MQPAVAIPITLLLVIRAYTRRSLTLPGIVMAALTATVHALHPSPVPFTLLCTFFVLGTLATKVKHDVKATLTLSSSGSSGGEGPRTTTQVVANSGCASLLILLHVYQYGVAGGNRCFGDPSDRTADVLLVGVISNYVSVAADTLSSELGILSKKRPVLITSLKPVPPGTNGGVTLAGIVAGTGGSAAIAAASLFLLPFCRANETASSPSLPTLVSTGSGSAWSALDKFGLFLFFTVWGTLGSLLDSLLGATLQASIIDRRTGKIVEGPGGVKVLTTSSSTSTHRPSSSTGTSTSDSATTGQPGGGREIHSRMINSGHDILDNNQINFLMASIMSGAGMLAASIAWHGPW